MLRAAAGRLLGGCAEAALVRGLQPAAAGARLGGIAGRLGGAPRLAGGAWAGVPGARGMVSMKEVTWYGARRSLDPTAPSVIRRRPTTPSQRHTAIVDKSLLYRGKPEKSLTVGKNKKGGRNNQGVITVRGRGGGNKRRYRIIDFKRATKENAAVEGVVDRIEYDPNRSGFIALIKHDVSVETEDPNIKLPRSVTMSYILCPKGLKVGQTVYARKDAGLDIQIGNAMPLRFIPVGSMVHNIELWPGKGGQFCRAAGTSAQVLEVDENKGLALLRMQSKEVRYVLINCMATIGEMSNPEHKNEVWGKAGRSRWYGWRPKVRGVAMNPIDHPHGGGEGKTHHGGHPMTAYWKKARVRTVRKLCPLIRTPRWKVKAQKKGK